MTADAARDMTGDGANYEPDDSSIKDRAVRVGQHVRDAFRRSGTVPADEDMDALQSEISGSLEELAGTERRQFEETLIEQLRNFVDIVGQGHLRAFTLGAIFASAVWTLAFVIVTVLALVMRSH